MIIKMDLDKQEFYLLEAFIREALCKPHTNVNYIRKLLILYDKLEENEDLLKEEDEEVE